MQRKNYCILCFQDKSSREMKYYLAIKEWNIAICSNMGEPRDYYTKWSKSNRERQIIIWYYLYVESKK